MGADQGLTRLFYDGACGLCRGAARFAARHDRSDRIRFAPLGGITFERLVPEASRAKLPDSLVVLTPEGKLLIRSEAVVYLLRRMPPPWRLVGGVLAWIPPLLRDGAYRLIARLRPARQVCSRGETRQDDRFDP